MKIVVKIFNIVYLVFAVIAITCFCTKPYISLEGQYSLENEQLIDFMPEDVKEILTPEELSEALDGEKVVVPLKLEVPASLVFNFSDKEAVSAEIDRAVIATVDNTVEQLQPTIHKIAEIIAKKTSNMLIRESIAEQIKEHLPIGSDTSDEKIQQLMEEAKIDDEYISEVTDEVYTILSQEGGSTVHEVMEGITDNIKDVCSKIGELDEVEDFDPDVISDEMLNGLEESMFETFKEYNICDEDGNITNIDKAIDALLISLLDSIGGETKPESAPAEEKRYSRAETSTEETENELTLKIRELIMNYVNNLDLAGYVNQYGLYILIFTLFLMLPWAMLALFSFIRVLRPKKCWCKTWYVFVFASLQVVLGIVLTVATAKFLPQIAGVLPLGDLNEVLNSLTLVVRTSSLIPSILYLIMIPMVIVYTVFAHKVKKQYKREKKEAKAAKKAA